MYKRNSLIKIFHRLLFQISSVGFKSYALLILSKFSIDYNFYNYVSISYGFS